MKIIVLGGGNCQLNMIRRLKKDGHYIILVDYLDSCPGALYADEHLQISTFDINEVIGAVLKHKADGIITMGTDQPVLTAAAAAEKAGMHFYVEPKTALSVTNKKVMKKKFVDNDIPTVKYRLIEKDFSEKDVEGILFPAVLKPVDSQGQRGIFKVWNIGEIEAHIEETLSYSREDEVLLEEYYENDEITVNGWVHEGKAHIVSVVDRVTMEKENRIGICFCHNFPSVHLKVYKNAINELTQKIVDVFGIQNGPLYFQYLIGDEGIKVNEIAMRIGGAYEDITIPLISGIDILGMLIEYTIKGKCNTDLLEKYDLEMNSKYVSTQMFFCRPGKIARHTPVEKLEKIDCVRRARYIIKIGDNTGSIENATARAGYFIAEGTNFEDMIKNVNDVYDNFEILNDKNENLIIKYSEYTDKYRIYGK